MNDISIDILAASHRAQFLDGAASAADGLATVLDGLVGKTYTRRYDARMPEGVAFTYRTDFGIDYFEAWYTAPGTPDGGYVDAYSGRRGVATIVDHRTDSRYLSWRFGARQYRIREDPFGGPPVVEALASAAEGMYPSVGADGIVYSYRARVSLTAISAAGSASAPSKATFATWL